MTLILASSSKYRRKLLERLNLDFQSQAPSCDEESLKGTFLRDSSNPAELASHLAISKARSIAAKHPEDTIIGSDQLVALNHQILGKPGNRAAAIEQILSMSARSHQLITAICVIHKGQEILHSDITTLHMRALDRDAATRYIELDNPIDCAGAYKLECAGISLFEKIESADQSAITGLPLIALCSILRDCGYQIP